MWVRRKVSESNQSQEIVEKFLGQFIENIKKTKFDGIVFDYDGTLCDPPERFKQPKPEISRFLNSLLAQGVNIGVATGRGQSVQKSLRQVIDKESWNNVIIGNYNGSIVLPLKDDLPHLMEQSSETLMHAHDLIVNDFLIADQADIEFRSKQLSTEQSGKQESATFVYMI